MPRSMFDQKYTASGAPVTTSDATTTSAGVFDVPDGAMGTVRVYVNARSGALVRSFFGDVGIERPVGGSARATVSVPFGLTVSGGDAGATTWVAQLDVSGNQVRARVTGVLATSIEWWVAFHAYWGAVT